MILYKKRVSEYNVGVLFAVLAAAGFSFKAIFVKQAYAVATIDPITLLSLRMLFSFPLFVIIGLFTLKGTFSLTAKETALLIFLGVTGYYGASILDFMGLKYITAGLERIILFSYPILTILISVFLLGKPFERRLILPMVLCTIGIFCACVSDMAFTQQNEVMYGVLFILASALCFAFYNAFSEPMIARLGSMRFSILAMLVSIFSVQLHFFSQLPASELVQPTDIYWICFQMAIFSTVLPVFLQSSAVKYIGVSRSVLISTLGPILTLYFGWILLDEAITFLQIIGTLLVLAGVMAIKLTTLRDKI